MPKVFLLAIVQSALLAGGQVFLKFALGRMLPFGWNVHFWCSLLLNWPFAVCGLLFTASGLLWFYIVKHYPLSLAYPMISLSYVFGLLAAALIFHEEVSALKWIGVVLIMAGCWMVGR